MSNVYQTGASNKIAIASAAAPTLEEGQRAVLSLDLKGGLRTSGSGGGGGAVTVADGSDAALGATADAAVSTDTTGTVSGKLRGLVKIFADIWDSTNHWLQIKVMNGTLLAPLRVDPVGTTAQPITASSLPLPTGAAKDRATSTAQNNGQVSVTTSPTQIVAANSARKRIVITNTGSTAVYLGPSGVATSTGHLLAGAAGYPFVIYTKAAIYGIVGAGTQTVTYWEEVE